MVGVESDPGISGRTWQRRGVVAAMSALESGDVQVIVLWRWSRLSRSRRDWALAADRADVAGGRIESATEPNDTSAAGKFGRGVTGRHRPIRSVPGDARASRLEQCGPQGRRRSKTIRHRRC